MMMIGLVRWERISVGRVLLFLCDRKVSSATGISAHKWRMISTSRQNHQHPAMEAREMTGVSTSRERAKKKKKPQEKKQDQQMRPPQCTGGAAHL